MMGNRYIAHGHTRKEGRKEASNSRRREEAADASAAKLGRKKCASFFPSFDLLLLSPTLRGGQFLRPK